MCYIKSRTLITEHKSSGHNADYTPRSQHVLYPEVALKFFMPMESSQNGHGMSLDKCFCFGPLIPQ